MPNVKPKPTDADSSYTLCHGAAAVEVARPTLKPAEMSSMHDRKCCQNILVCENIPNCLSMSQLAALMAAAAAALSGSCSCNLFRRHLEALWVFGGDYEAILSQLKRDH